jgi:hypothetical protein
MNPRERCEAAEHALARAGELLLAPTPGAIEGCLQTLGQAIEILEDLAGGTAPGRDPDLRLAASRLREGADALSLRLDHGTKLLRGWMQLQRGEGYTRRGAPRFVEIDAMSHHEA